jgi:hypothetical protein
MEVLQIKEMGMRTQSRGFMNPSWAAWVRLLVMAVVVAAPAHAQRMPSALPGASDHPPLSRYAGSVLAATSTPMFEALIHVERSAMP